MKKKLTKYQPGGSTPVKGDMNPAKKVVKVTTYTPKSKEERNKKAEEIFKKWDRTVQAVKRAKEDDEVGGRYTESKKKGGAVKKKK